MKNIILITLISFFSFQTIGLFSQPTEFTQSNDFIIKMSGDTLNNIIISESKRKTNEYLVTYQNDSHEFITLSSNDVLKFFDGEKIYLSESTENENPRILINYFAQGYIKIGESITKKGMSKFWIRINNKLIDLSEYEYSLNTKLSEEIDDFTVFENEYKNKINYDYKSLGEFVSNYNAFKEPKKYIPVKYKYKKKYKVGIIAYPYILSSKEDNTEIDLDKHYAYQLGLTIDLKYSNNISISISPTLYNNAYSKDINKLYINSFNTDIGFNYVVYRYKFMKLRISPGIGLVSQINSYYETRDSFQMVKVSIKGTSISFFANLQLEVLKNLSVLFGINSYKLKPENSNTSYRYSPDNIDFVEFKIGLSYLLGH